MKRMFYTEAAYFIGLVTLGIGHGVNGTGGFRNVDGGCAGISCLFESLRVSELVFFRNAEYCFQAFLIIVLAVVLGSFKRRYLFSFITAFIYGNVLDIMMKVVGLVPGSGIFPGQCVTLRGS